MDGRLVVVRSALGTALSSAWEKDSERQQTSSARGFMLYLVYQVLKLTPRHVFLIQYLVLLL
jgi:hypothetical protein